MNDAWIVYDKQDVEKNQFFIDKMTEIMKEHEVTLRLVTEHAISRRDLPSFVINRSRDTKFIKDIESHNIRVFNGSRINALSNDKWAAHFWARYLGMPVLDGALYNPSNITLPAVVKSRMGHGGNDVQIVSTPEEAHKLRLHGNDEDYMMQKIASERGKDLRVYIIGDEIVACMLRTNENDFRANYSLGAKAELVDLPEEVERYLKVVIYDLHPDFIGVDFLIDDGKYVFNEVEDPVGSKMLYDNTDIDPIRLFADHIMSVMKLD
ncbi:MAG: RimK family alpha-L-glutamate ligase [Candidatus Methanomethylophilaceae archaeon]